MIHKENLVVILASSPEDDLPPLVRGEGHQQEKATTSPLRMTAGLPPDNLQLALRLESITYLDQATNCQMDAPWATATCK